VSFCRHHPATDGRWYCEDCELSFCDQCVYSRHDQPIPNCLHCGQQLEFKQTHSDVLPFWRRLNDFFLYPFQLGPMVLIGIAVLASILVPPGWIALITSLFIVFLQFKYGFNVIAAMAEGEFHAPSLRDTISGGGYDLVYKQFAIVFLMLVVPTIISVQLSALLGTLLGIFFLLVLPMSTIVLAREQSLKAALNPIILVTSIYRIGWAYLLVYLYLLMMFASSLTFGQLAYEYLGANGAQVVTAASGYYFALVMYSLMGYMMYQYRHRLDAASTSTEMAFTPEADREDPRVHVLLQQGEYQRAMDLLANDWKSKRYPPTLIEKYVKIVRFTAAWDHLREKLSSILAELLKAKHTAMIPRLLRDLYAVQPDYEIKNLQTAMQVAEAVRERGDSKLAVRLLQNQHKMTQHTEHQRKSLRMLADILEQDMQKADVAAALREQAKQIKDPPARDDGLSLV
jgi:hypothetical protein